eukprot:scaffold651_cov284-Prasinococcus_capsulatus_cf.AAC.7
MAKAREPFDVFMQGPWWDVVAPVRRPAAGDAAQEEEEEARGGATTTTTTTTTTAAAAKTAQLRGSCQRLVRESSALLREAMRAHADYDAAWEELLTEDFVASLVGGFELNCIGGAMFCRCWPRPAAQRAPASRARCADDGGILMRSPVHHYLRVATQRHDDAARWAAQLALNAAREREESDAAMMAAEGDEEEDDDEDEEEEEEDDDDEDDDDDDDGEAGEIGPARADAAAVAGARDAAEAKDSEYTTGSLDATGLFAVACMMNHSCDPVRPVPAAADAFRPPTAGAPPSRAWWPCGTARPARRCDLARARASERGGADDAAVGARRCATPTSTPTATWTGGGRSCGTTTASCASARAACTRPPATTPPPRSRSWCAGGNSSQATLSTAGSPTAERRAEWKRGWALV